MNFNAVSNSSYNETPPVPRKRYCSAVMPLSAVSSSFYDWTKPVPREQWDPLDAQLVRAARPYTAVERTIGYDFRDKGFLLKAFTHGSFPAGVRIIPGFMRPMDFMGDALLKQLLTVHLYGCIDPLAPKALHETRQRIECNRFLGFVVAHHGMHKLLRYSSPSLSEEIVQYVRMLRDGEYPGYRAQAPPKPLADLFESLTAAVYLDSDQNQAAVYRSLFPLLRRQIDTELEHIASIAEETTGTSQCDASSE
ncbi:uncharacterized protein LOC144109565 [Amblyomma americanum]